jgi:hypothetical protein
MALADQLLAEFESLIGVDEAIKKKSRLPESSIIFEGENLQSSTLKSFISKNYPFCIDSIHTIDVSGEEDLMNKLKEKNLTVLENTEVDPYNNISTTIKTCYNDRHFLLVTAASNSANIKVSAYSKTLPENSILLEEIGEIAKAHIKDMDAKIMIHEFGWTQTGEITVDEYSFNPSMFDKLNSSFYPYIDVDLMFDVYDKSNESILFLAGLPGTGKSKLISLYMKHLTRNGENIRVFNVKSEMVLENSNFWSSLKSNEPQLVILDDFDSSLLPRSSARGKHNQTSAVTELLNFTDGIVECNSKFIITTNMAVHDVDTAILRKGRLFDAITMRKLNLEEGKDLLSDSIEDAEDVDKIMEKYTEGITPAEVAFEASNYIITKDISSNKKTSSYLLEDGISTVKNLKVSRKIGLK